MKNFLDEVNGFLDDWVGIRFSSSYVDPYEINHIQKNEIISMVNSEICVDPIEYIHVMACSNCNLIYNDASA
jgi:hypothetical protein